MGAEAVLVGVGELVPHKKEDERHAAAAAPVVLGLQPSALVDHVARVDWSLLDQIPERGTALRVAIEELENILKEVETHILSTPGEPSPVKTIAGGSVANTIRGLAAVFGVTCGLIGACGGDEQGQLFVQNMISNEVNLSKLRRKQGSTGQCVCLVDAAGNRTMRPCLSDAARLQADELRRENFRGSRTVRNFREPLLELLESGDTDLCFANEDGAVEVIRGKHDTTPEAALNYLVRHCQWAVVPLGPNGCIARHGNEMLRVPAIWQAQPLDATGAGDLFANGFLYGLVEGLSLEECCRVGSCSGGSVIRSLGGEVSQENRQWIHKQMQIKGLTVPSFQRKCA